MSDTNNDGGPAPYSDENAFPVPHPNMGRGLTIRDWFAGQALPEIVRILEASDNGLHFDEAASDAYMLADAMLKRRQQP